MAYLQREENLSRLSGFSWLRAFCLKWLVGHGKYPFRAAWWCLGVIAIGTVVFWKKNGMALKAGEPADSAYSPFWYSLGVFLPVVDLQMSKIWSPKAHRTIAPHYMRFQILLGWILVPLFAAGITGLVK
jgi:hypothetical protein